MVFTGGTICSRSSSLTKLFNTGDIIVRMVFQAVFVVALASVLFTGSLQAQEPIAVPNV
jgi:hypothetical protein